MTTNHPKIVLLLSSGMTIATVASNFHSAEVMRFSRQSKKRIPVDQPHLIHKYNMFMGGVDRCDQNLSLYRVSVRGKKRYFPIISYCLDLAEYNAWQLHRAQGGKLDHLNFRRVVVETMLESNANITRKKGRPHSLQHAESRLDNKDHYLVEQEKQTRCRVCHKKVKRQCIKCEVAIHVPCFPIYHKS